MDKKAKYQQPNAKGTATDAKKNQDVTSSKLFPKSSRRREPVGANSYPKYDQQRKSNAQKTKNFDKRPKSKGYYHGNSKEDSKVVADESAELGSVMAQGSKKQNLNHLLNFHYAPRDVQGGWNHGRISGYISYNNYNRWLPPIQRHKYNKEQFLQANCQFVVTANGDYSRYLNDPDALVDWNLVQQIRFYSSDNLSCPICLCPPVAGKMTRCGHVYCWPCILHYLALSDKAWRKCPICYESIHKTDLKSVVEITQNDVNIGDHVSLRLMRREKGSLLAVPVHDVESPPPTTFLSVSENFRQQNYSKLLLAQDNDIMDIIESERVQLKLELLDNPHSPENCFIEQALGELLTREKLLFEGVTHVEKAKSELSISNNETSESENSESRTSPNIENEPDKENNYSLLNDSNANDRPNHELNEITNETMTPGNSQKFHYFYQAEGGQNVYLHAMNVKMLEMQYGSLEKSPLVISGKLIEKEVGSYTEELRRRMRYLCHLPVTSQFEIVEIDLQPPILSGEVLASFEEQILARERKRKRRDREERKREKKINEEENKLMGKYPTPKVHIESRKHFPQFQSEIDEMSVPSPAESVVASSVASSPSVSSFDDLTSAVINETWSSSSNNGRSFAQMLQTNGSRRTVAWPTMNNSRKAEPTNNLASESNETESIDPELEEYIAPSHSQSLGDALAQALEKSEFFNQTNKSIENVTSSKKKKKKGKATVLFATNMARAP